MQSRTETLKLTFPMGRTILLALFILFVFFGAGEVLVRTEPVREFMPAPSLGTVHRNLEVQVNLLEQSVASKDAIDCVMLGDSTVMTDFIPDVFELGFYAQTGEEINCLNLGVGASTVASSVALAEVILNEYQPKLLILGLQALNFTVSIEDQESGALLKTPWVRYKLGQVSVEGWLYDHSRLFGYRPLLRKLAQFELDYRSVVRGDFPDDSGIINGYFPLNGQGSTTINEPPSPNSDHPFDVHYFAELGNFHLLPENVEALENIAKLGEETNRVLIIEMPVAESFVYYYGNGPKDHEAFIDIIVDHSSDYDVPFWQTSELRLFASDDWYNRNHLNTDGAYIFSEWLGRQVGQATLNNSSLGETWNPTQ